MAALFSFVLPETMMANAAADYWEARYRKPPFQGVFSRT